MRAALGLAALSLLLPACGGGSTPPTPGATPRETFETLVRLVTEDNREGIYFLLTDRAQRAVRERLAKLGELVLKDEVPERLRKSAVEVLGMSVEEFLDLPPEQAYARGYAADEIDHPSDLKLASLQGANFADSVAVGQTDCRVRYRLAGGEDGPGEILLTLEKGAFRLPNERAVFEKRE